MDEQQTPVVLNIKMTPAGLELVIGALRKLPHEQVHDLVQELFVQGRAEVQRLQAEAESESVEEIKAGCTD